MEEYAGMQTAHIVFDLARKEEVFELINKMHEHPAIFSIVTDAVQFVDDEGSVWTLEKVLD